MGDFNPYDIQNPYWQNVIKNQYQFATRNPFAAGQKAQFSSSSGGSGAQSYMLGPASFAKGGFGRVGNAGIRPNFNTPRDNSIPELGRALDAIDTGNTLINSIRGVRASDTIRRGINSTNAQIATTQQQQALTASVGNFANQFGTRVQQGKQQRENWNKSLTGAGLPPLPGSSAPGQANPSSQPTTPTIQTTPATGATPSTTFGIGTSGAIPATTNLSTAGSPPSITRPPTSRNVSRPSPTATPGTFVRPSSPTTSPPTSRTFNRLGATSQVPVTGTRPPSESESAPTRSNPLVNWRTSRQARKMARDPMFKNPLLQGGQTPTTSPTPQTTPNNEQKLPGMPSDPHPTSNIPYGGQETIYLPSADAKRLSNPDELFKNS